ncbi:hypothetical protein [uncultured Shewanella sp.]|uniref:hypothetical protein n=1 Tax=uncultured Shewanella sp. TaxID=173975 RepID=UPI0026396B47|nr:hypothetical protein [uncultured Shewanella sp.]
MKKNNNRLLLSIFLSLLSFQVFSQDSPVLYTEYKSVLEGKKEPQSEWFSRKDIPADRLVNIIIHQEKTISKDNIDTFIKNIDLLLEQKRMASFTPILKRTKINALIISGRYEEALRLIGTGTDEYQLAKIRTLMMLGRYDEALFSYNKIPASQWSKNEKSLIKFGKEFLFLGHIARVNLAIPMQMQQTFSNEVIKIYLSFNSYRQAYAEYKFMTSKSLTVESKREHLAFNMNFAHKHKLYLEEVESIESYLKTFNDTNPVTLKDITLVNNSTNTLVRLRYELSGYNSLSFAYIEPYLLAQSQAAKIDVKSREVYLKNRIMLSKENKDLSYFSDITELAVLMKNKSIIVSKFDKKRLSPQIQELLLKGYFSIPMPDDMDVYMASAYLPFIDKCSDVQSLQLVRALKGDYFVNNNQLNKAYSCFKDIEWNAIKLPNKLKSALVKEQLQVRYLYAKQHNDIPNVIALSMQSKDGDMVFDATKILIENSAKSVDLNKVDSAITQGWMTKAQIDVVNEMVLADLRNSGNREALKTRLLKSENKHAFELAWLYAEDDNHQKAITYIVKGLTFNKSVDSFTEVKAIRYLDSYYNDIPTKDRQGLSSLRTRYSSINYLFKLQKIESTLAPGFQLSNRKVIAQVKSLLAHYKTVMKALSRPMKRANETTKLYLEMESTILLSQQLNALSQQTENTKLSITLNKQVTKFRQKLKVIYQQIISEKQQDIYDIRILKAFQFQLQLQLQLEKGKTS